MGRLYPILFLANIALMVVALIDCISSDNNEIRALPKFFWILLILLFSPVGPIVWFITGRPQATATGAAGRLTPGRAFPDSGRRQRSRPLAPDDDPEFLQSLSKQRKDDEELLRQWEADLRRREDELRRKQQDDQPPQSTDTPSE